MSFNHLIEERESVYLTRRLSRVKPFRFEYERRSARLLIKIVQSFGCVCFAHVRPPSITDAFLFSHPHSEGVWLSIVVGPDYGGYSAIELHTGPKPEVTNKPAKEDS